MTEAEDGLIEPLSVFLQDSLRVAERLRDSGSGTASADVPGFADSLANLPAAAEANSVALRVAQANSYMVREAAEGSTARLAGRPLTARSLMETGVAGLLLSGTSVDVPTLAQELAGYLAGPPVPVWDYAIVDASLEVRVPVPVVQGWELVTPSMNALLGLAGVPSAAGHVTRHSFNLDLHPGLVMLRRVMLDAKPSSGFTVFFDSIRRAYALWLPLLALSLYQNQVLHLWARYVVEPARRVDVRFDHVYTEPWTPDGVTEVEVVRQGDYEVSAADEPRFRRFLSRLAPKLDTAARPSKSNEKEKRRLRRVAEHFLTAGEDAIGEGEVLSELHAESVLHYVIALEALLTGSDSDKADLTRKVSQRAAVLAGTDDQMRLKVAEIVRAAYNARSKYAHGSSSEASIDLPELRQVVRDCITARLILGEPTGGGSRIADLADAALLDHSVLTERVRKPVEEFWSGVDSALSRAAGLQALRRERTGSPAASPAA